MLSLSAVVREAMPMVATMNASPRGPLLSFSVTSVMAMARSSSGGAGVGEEAEDGELRIEDGEEGAMLGATRATTLLGDGVADDGLAVETAGCFAGAIRCRTPIAASTKMRPNAVAT